MLLLLKTRAGFQVFLGRQIFGTHGIKAVDNLVSGNPKLVGEAGSITPFRGVSKALIRSVLVKEGKWLNRYYLTLFYA